MPLLRPQSSPKSSLKLRLSPPPDVARFVGACVWKRLSGSVLDAAVEDFRENKTKKKIRIDRQDGDAHPGQMPPSEADDDPAVLEAALDSPARTVSTILVQ